jgi:4-hydroxy 2-oxovalerate aldolase
MKKKADAQFVEKKLNYRPEIKVLDCTIRDGGLVNNCKFTDDFVRAVYNTCVAAGVDYMEVGYKGDKKLYTPGEYGAWKFCTEDDMRRIVGENPSDLKLTAMADVERCDYHNDILPAEKSVLDMIRIATYVHQLPAALEMIKAIHDKGYETTINVMAASVCKEAELDEALEVLAASEVDVIYLVDSFGSFYSEEIQALTKKYMKYAKAAGKEIGIHAHNNQQLAYANTLEAMILGANFLDSTIGGLGRGAGNCPTELLLGFLKNPKFHLRPVVQCIEEQIVPLRKQISWGFDIPYMLTGQMNMHPKSAIAFLDGETPEKYTEFYDSVVAEE